jgi:hypothetical protein
MDEVLELQKKMEHYRPETNLDVPGGLGDVLGKARSHLDQARVILNNELL